MKAQSALEYLFVIALILALLIPTLHIALKRSNTASVTEQASTTVNAIVNAANEIYYLGPGNKNTVAVSIPGGVQSFYLLDNEVIITIRSGDGTSEFVGLAKANFTSGPPPPPSTPIQLPTTRGLKYITVEHLDSGRINVSFSGGAGGGGLPGGPGGPGGPGLPGG